jgi:hypothetical protein
LARPPRQQLAGHASGRLVFGRFPKALGFFRHPFFKGKLVLNAAPFHDAILPICPHIETLVPISVCPIPDIEIRFPRLDPGPKPVKFPGMAENKARYPPLKA